MWPAKKVRTCSDAYHNVLRKFDNLGEIDGSTNWRLSRLLKAILKFLVDEARARLR